jgi:hypothetical protein
MDRISPEPPLAQGAGGAACNGLPGIVGEMYADSTDSHDFQLRDVHSRNPERFGVSI